MTTITITNIRGEKKKIFHVPKTIFELRKNRTKISFEIVLSNRRENGTNILHLYSTRTTNDHFTNYLSFIIILSFILFSFTQSLILSFKSFTRKLKNAQNYEFSQFLDVMVSFCQGRRPLPCWQNFSQVLGKSSRPAAVDMTPLNRTHGDGRSVVAL